MSDEHPKEDQVPEGFTYPAYTGEGRASTILINKDGSLTIEPVLGDTIAFTTLTGSYVLPLDSATAVLLRPREVEVDRLKKQVEEQTATLQAALRRNEGAQQELEDLRDTVSKLEQELGLYHLLSHVGRDARKALLAESSVALRDGFLAGKECDAFVMSVDIRRSTELMLKARSPDGFSAFMVALCRQLTEIVFDCNGVVDKFTGDGMLAFFPDFFTGPDACYYALLAADRSHAAFKTQYEASRGAFISVLTDMGLGIGIDYGRTRIVSIAGGLTVVGVPVVYACRFGGGPPRLTHLNQPAYEKVSAKLGSHCKTEETELEIKHDGKTLAYRAQLTDNGYKPERPPWSPEGSQPSGAAG